MFTKKERKNTNSARDVRGRVLFFCVPNVDDRKYKDKQNKGRVSPLCHLLSQGTSLLNPTIRRIPSCNIWTAQDIGQFITFSLLLWHVAQDNSFEREHGHRACAWLNSRIDQCPSFRLCPHFSTSSHGVPELSQHSLFPQSKRREMAKAVLHTLVYDLPSCFVGACMQNYLESEHPWNLHTFCALSLLAFVVFRQYLHILFFSKTVPSSPNE